MCGIRSKQLLPLLVALLPLSSPSYSEETYEITETELTELETILSEQSETIENQRSTLETLRRTIESQRNTLQALETTIETQRNTLTALSEITETQETTISELGTSFREYEREARGMTIKVGAVTFTIGAAAGAIAVLLF